MAEKRDSKKTPKPKAAGKPAGKTKDTGTSHEKSGEVKGPMGVGGRKKPSARATVKKPSKTFDKGEHLSKNAPENPSTDSQKNSKVSALKGMPEPLQEKKALPEKTTTTEEHLIVAPVPNTTTEKGKEGIKTSTGMHPKDNTPIILKASTETAKHPKQERKAARIKGTGTSRKKEVKKPLTEKIDAEEVKQKIRERKNKASEEKEKKPVAKKMARRKAVEGISAEEKSNISNTTITEDLKSTVTNAAKDLIEDIIPSKETQKEFKELAKSVLPKQKDVKKKAKKIANQVSASKDDISAFAAQMGAEIASSGDSREGAEEFSARKQAGNQETSSDEETGVASLISEYDVHLFREGKHFHLYKKFGSHVMNHLGVNGVYFALWAPNAQEVSVIGDFNDWDRQANPMKVRQDSSGVWELFVPEAKNGSIYKYFIRSNNGYEVEKGDPFAFMWEIPPKTASVVWDLENSWQDQEWLTKRKSEEGRDKVFSIYELHIGSWKRVPEENLRALTYRELAEDLPGYLKEMGFTHVEFMPIMEHPFGGSWGYQITGYFAPSSRYGNPQDFMHLIDALHREDIGVILDWVPSHFPDDLHGLHYFDGTFLYEHQEKHKGFHPDWQSYIFNYGRNEVKCFLISNALFWLDRFHADGLRVDAVASMLYLDYSRKEGEWEPNEHGGRENLEAISFLKEFNEVVYKEYPDIVTIAEESTAWPMVSRPTYLGGLGFGMKWMMGWMHDTLEYFKKDPIHRKHHQNTITFSLNYAFSENFVLPLSHDEVVYGKQALLNKMPGDHWQKFANLRTLYSYMYAHPGTKLLFMGAEFGQSFEWNHDSSLDWHLLQYDLHRQLRETVKSLNHLYKTEPALYENSFNNEGFQWVDINDAENSVISFLRKGKSNERILVICNFTPVPRENYHLRISEEGSWKEIFNSDEERFGGSNMKNYDSIESQKAIGDDHNFIVVSLPPLSVLYLKKN